MYRIRVSTNLRFELGLEGRTYSNAVARHHSVGIIGEGVLEATRRLELTLTLVPHHTWFVFDSPFFTDTNAYGVRVAGGVQLLAGDRVTLGLTPLAFTSTSSESIGVIGQWEPRAWLALSF
jgi:hypothetical protein